MAIYQIPQRRNLAGSGFTNLQRILQASKGGQLGQAVSSGVQKAGEAARGALQKAGTEFQQQVGAEQQRQAAEEQRAKTVLGDVTKASEEDIKAFQGIRGGLSQGPSGLTGAEELQRQAQEAQQLGQATGSEVGRLGLLQRFVGGGQRYTGGQQALDALLLGQQDPSQLRQSRRGTFGLPGQVGVQQAAAQEVGKELASSAKGLAQRTTEELAKQAQETESGIKASFDITQAQELQRQQAIQDIKNLMLGEGQKAIFDESGKEIRAAVGPSKERLDDINKALSLAQSLGILQEGDISSIETLQRKLATPIQQMTRQKVEIGPSGYFGYGGAAPGQTYTANAGYKYSGLQLGDLLAQSLATQGPEALTREGIISDEQRAKANVLAKLAGTQQEFGEQATERFKGTKGAFGFEKAQAMTDEDIAKLRGESILDLPTEYLDVPVAERLRRTLAPTATELSADVGKQLDELFGSDTSAGSRAKALVNAVVLSPARLGAGLVTEGVSNTASKVNQMIGNYLSLDPSRIGQGLAQSVTWAPSVATNLVGDVLSGASNIVSKVPLLGKPISNVVLKPVTGVVKSIGSAIGSVFCYATGTKIKMKNGKFKPIEKIKVGDEIALGGKVTAVGVSEPDDLFKYKNVIVNGAHAVFENGSFIRVRNSKQATPIKKADKNIMLHPIATENHLILTETHIGSDFSEFPGAVELPEEERIKKLNSYLSRNEKLKKLSALLDIQNEKNKE